MARQQQHIVWPGTPYIFVNPSVKNKLVKKVSFAILLLL